MKKFLLTSTLLLVVLAVSAQIKVAPKMKKGDKKVYVAEQTTKVGKTEAKMTIETLVEVADANADGYVINSTVTDTKVETDMDDMTGRILALTTNMLKNMRTSYATDKNGQVTGILNFESTKKQTEEMVRKLMDDIKLPDMISKDMLIQTAMANITEEAMLNGMKMNNSPFALNGKTISSGTEDEFSTKEGIKMKRTFTVNSDGSIGASSKINMSLEEMTRMIVDMTSKLVPNQKEEVKQQITQMVQNGMLKINAKDNATYTIGADGWVDSITAETYTDSMGQKTTVTSKVRLKK